MVRFVLTCMVALAAMAAPAQPFDPIQITFTDTVANPGDSIEVAVHLASGNASPSAMVLFFNYDPDRLEPFDDFYERVLMDVAGDPILDVNGNPVTVTSAVRPGPAAEDAGKGVDSEIHSDGLMSIAVVGLNEDLMENGLLLTIAFKVSESAEAGEELVIDGRETEEQNGSSATTIVTGGAVESLLVDFQNAFVDIGCERAEAPTGVQATQNRADGVRVTWTAPEEGLEYRVFRGTGTNPDLASPLGEGWQTELDFLDITASVPAATEPAFPGCPAPPEQPVRYNYWVKARNIEGCESTFSTPLAVGSRTAGKAVSLADSLLLALAAGALLLGRRRKS